MRGRETIAQNIELAGTPWRVLTENSSIGAIDGSVLASKNHYSTAMSLRIGLGKSIVESDSYFNAKHDVPN